MIQNCQYMSPIIKQQCKSEYIKLCFYDIKVFTTYTYTMSRYSVRNISIIVLCYGIRCGLSVQSLNKVIIQCFFP